MAATRQVEHQVGEWFVVSGQYIHREFWSFMAYQAENVALEPGCRELGVGGRREFDVGTKPGRPVLVASAAAGATRAAGDVLIVALCSRCPGQDPDALAQSCVLSPQFPTIACRLVGAVRGNAGRRHGTGDLLLLGRARRAEGHAALATIA